MNKLITVTNVTNGRTCAVRANGNKITPAQGKRIDENLGWGLYRAEFELVQMDKFGNGQRVIEGPAQSLNAATVCLESNRSVIASDNDRGY